MNNLLKEIADTLFLQEQNGFRKGRSCTDNVTIIRHILEERKEYNLETYIGFIDYEKAFDRVNRHNYEKLRIDGGSQTLDMSYSRAIPTN